MIKKIGIKKIGLLASILMLTAGPLLAKNALLSEQLQLPQCLLSHLDIKYKILAKNKQLTIIEVASADIEAIIHTADTVKCGRFVNLSHRLAEPNANAKKLLAPKSFSRLSSSEDYAIRHSPQVFAAISQVDKEPIMAVLTRLTQFENRSATKENGVEAARWLKASFEKMAVDNKRQDVQAYFVASGSRYKQPSLVTVIGSHLKEPGIVIGAHMDTLDGRMPGAGDDGSGSASLMEIARVLLETPQDLKRPIYLIWYAAEERGLVGSQHVVSDFLKKSIPIKAVMQLDMTGFRNDRNDPTMWIYEDYTDAGLSQFIAQLIDFYINVPVGKSRCGYGCSDHASWMEKNIPAVFPCETDFMHHNSKIHTASDTVDRLTPEHMVNFSKLGLAFVLELALK
ncbi:MAG: M20/M25/M40 family metallo-hydrolase [Silvanigrellaceae bacterium]|nr:M20/M25/M40 family metallo-hydrolase [Silvanigrellaceae bacterium]